VITYPVNNKVEKTGQENEKAMAWERAYINLVKVLNFHPISKLMCSEDTSQ
jgi:Niemann-Pick C1 protein